MLEYKLMFEYGDEDDDEIETPEEEY